MIKFRLHYDKDKEEVFLNDMATKGYAMTSFCLGLYKFEKCKAGEYTYKIDLIKNKSTSEKNDYYDLIREIGGEVVQTLGEWTYFRKKGKFELYSDNESKIEQYSKIQKTFLIFALAEILILPSQIHLYLISKMAAPLFSTILICFISIVFFYQVYKCRKKIAHLKNEIEN